MAGKNGAGKALFAAFIVAGLASGAHAGASTGSHNGGDPDSMAATPAGAANATSAVAYAKAQLGCPYTWGGTGPCSAGYDCSGLVQQAWAAAGVSIERTADEQWNSLRHIPASQRAVGMLVFAPGADGTWSAPGHVGMLLGRWSVIEAYATGYPIKIVSLSTFGAKAGGIIGYAEVQQ
jgi:cell wall-associated NlpC family hydrolase